MKHSLFVILVVVSLTSCSLKHKMNQGSTDGMTFEELRTWKTNYLAQKQEMIKQEQACINAATDKPGLKKCTDDIHAKWMELMKDSKKQK